MEPLLQASSLATECKALLGSTMRLFNRRGSSKDDRELEELRALVNRSVDQVLADKRPDIAASIKARFSDANLRAMSPTQRAEAYAELRGSTSTIDQLTELQRGLEQAAREQGISLRDAQPVVRPVASTPRQPASPEAELAELFELRDFALSNARFLHAMGDMPTGRWEQIQAALTDEALLALPLHERRRFMDQERENKRRADESRERSLAILKRMEDNDESQVKPTAQPDTPTIARPMDASPSQQDPELQDLFRLREEYLAKLREKRDADEELRKWQDLLSDDTLLEMSAENRRLVILTIRAYLAL